MFLQNGGATFRRLHALHLWHGSFGDCEKMKCLSVFFRLRLDMFPDGQMASEEKAQSLFWALQLKWHFFHHYVGNPGGRAFQRWRSGASNQAGDCCGTNSHASLLFTDIFIFLVTIDVFMNMWCVCDYVCASADPSAWLKTLGVHFSVANRLFQVWSRLQREWRKTWPHWKKSCTVNGRRLCTLSSTVMAMFFRSFDPKNIAIVEGEIVPAYRPTMMSLPHFFGASC